MKKFLSVIFVIMIFASAVYAESDNGNLKVGVLSKLGMSQSDFQTLMDSEFESGKTQLFTSGSNVKKVEFIFYDSLNTLQMALNAGEIDEMQLPEDVAEYVMNVSNNYKVSSVSRTMPLCLSLGFRANESPETRNKINEALMSMKSDGTLAILQAKYIADPGIDEPEPVKFEKYDNIKEIIKVAVTGDLPPIDFVSAGGQPAGFNTAVLSEIAKRLKINVELVNIDSGARVAALSSGRADVVFWFQSYVNKNESQPDVPEGIVLSEPYYDWKEYLNIRKK